MQWLISRLFCIIMYFPWRHVLKWESDVENINTTLELDVIKVGGFLSGILVSKMI